MGKLFRRFQPLDHRAQWRLWVDKASRVLKSPADILTALDGIDEWAEMLEFIERRLSFVMRPEQRMWLVGELEKRQQARKTLTEMQCTAQTCKATWRGPRSVPQTCPECGAPGELALEGDLPATEPAADVPQTGIVLG